MTNKPIGNVKSSNQVSSNFSLEKKLARTREERLRLAHIRKSEQIESWKEFRKQVLSPDDNNDNVFMSYR